MHKALLFSALVVSLLYSNRSFAQELDAKSISEIEPLSTTRLALLAGFRPGYVWEVTEEYRMVIAVRYEYIFPEINWLSLGVELSYSQNSFPNIDWVSTGQPGASMGVTTGYTRYPRLGTYARVDLHPVQMFNPESPFDLFLGAGYGLYQSEYESGWDMDTDFSLQGGFRYWVNNQWGASFEVGIRGQSQVLLGLTYQM